MEEAAKEFIVNISKAVVAYESGVISAIDFEIDLLEACIKLLNQRRIIVGAIGAVSLN